MITGRICFKDNVPAETDATEKKWFSLHWGRGGFEEEVQISAQYHSPTIRLLKFLEGDAVGAYEIKFCHYDHNGRFQRSPLIIDVNDLEALRKLLENAPKLKRFLAQLVT